MLEAEYQNALADVGLGHEGLKELEEYEAWKKEQRRLQEEVAGVECVYQFRKRTRFVILNINFID
jgi:hypothetical protein